MRLAANLSRRTRSASSKTGSKNSSILGRKSTALLALPLSVALAMPLTYSIANGIAFGFITWTVVKLFSGRVRELNPAMVILSILFVIKLGWFNA